MTSQCPKGEKILNSGGGGEEWGEKGRLPLSPRREER